jgi:hypothetical protein
MGLRISFPCAPSLPLFRHLFLLLLSFPLLTSPPPLVFRSSSFPGCVSARHSGSSLHPVCQFRSKGRSVPFLFNPPDPDGLTSTSPPRRTKPPLPGHTALDGRATSGESHRHARRYSLSSLEGLERDAGPVTKVRRYRGTYSVQR